MAERKDITNKYLITSGGKEEEYNAEKVDNYGVVNAAKNLFDEGATIRMRDKDGSDYDIPLTEYDQAVSGGLRPFVLRRETVYLPKHKEEPIAQAQAQAPEVDWAPVAPQRNIGVLGHSVMGAQTFNETPEEEKKRKAEEQQFKERYEREKDMRDAVTSQMDETYEALEKRRGEIEDEVRDEQNARYLAAYGRKVPYALRKKNTAEEPPVVGDPRNIRTKEEGEAYNKSVIQDIEAREKESENERVRREELQAIGAGQRKIEATRDMLGAVERNVQDENVKNAIMGVYDTAKRMSTWDFGATNVGDAATMIDVTNKMSRGEALTEAEDEMLTAMATSQLLNEAYGSHVGVMYEVGQSIPQSVGFMIALATNPASGAGKAFQAWALKKFGRAGAGKLMRKLASYTARGVGDVAEAAAASLTTGGGITAANILNERLGTTQYKAGEDGVEYAGQADQKSMGAIGGLLFDDDWDGRSIGQWLGGDAMGLGLKNSVIENYTEMAGEYFAPLSKYMRNGTSKMFRVAAGKEGRLGLDRVADFLEVAPSKKFDRLLGRYRYKTLEEAMHFNGVVGETLEEELGMMLDAVLPGGDANMKWFGFNPPKEGTPEYNEYQNSMFNWHNQLVTVLSVAAMTPLFSGAGKVQQHFREKPLMDAVDGLFNAYGVDESRDRNNESVPAKIREELASMKPTDAADKIMELVNNGTIQNNDQLRATMQYAGAAIAYQTGTVNHNYNMANDADPVTKMAKEAFSAGTNVAPDKAYNAYSGLADARENLESVGGKEMVDIVDGFGVQDDEEFSAYLNSITDTALRTAAQRYWLNKNRAWGYQWKTEDDVERAEDKARRGARTHAKENNSGVLYFTTGIYNGKQVYVEGSTGNTTTIIGEDGVPEMVPTSLVTDIKNTRLENAADGIRDAIVAERNAAFTRHPRTEEPRVGLVLHTPEDGDIIISRIDDDGTIWYQSATIDGNTGEWKPAGGVPGRIAEAAVYDLQNGYYRQQDRNSAEGQLQAQAEEESVVQVDEQIKQPLTGSAKFRDELNAMGDAGVDAAEMVDDMIDKGFDAETIHKSIANGTGEGVTETANRYADARLAEINAAGAQQTEAEAQQAAEEVAAVQTPIQTQNMPAEFGEVQQRWQGANKIVGGVHFYTMPKSGGEKKATRLKGHYVLVEQGAATASHDPHTFEPVPGLTDENGQTWNSRDYKGNSENQFHVKRIGASYDSSALDKAPIVSSDGVVWSGNNRVMSGQLAAENGTDKDYIEALAESAEAFGFTEEQVRAMQHPRVYFVPDAESAQAAGLGYDRLSFGRFNAADQKVSSAIEVGAELGKSIKPGTFQRLADIINGYETGLKGLLANKKSKGAKQVIDALIDAEEVSMAGSINKSQFYDENDGLTEDGEMLINAAFMGYIFSGDTETLERITSLKKKQMAAIAEAMPEITQNRTLGEGSLDDIIREAIRVVTEANKGRGTLDDYLNTMEFNFDGGAGRWNADVYGPVVSSIARAINGQGASLKGILASYNNSYGQDMFGNSSRDGIIRDILRNQGYDVAAAAPAQEAAPAAPTQETPAAEQPAAGQDQLPFEDAPEQPANEMTEEEKQAADKKIKRDAVRQMFLQTDEDNIGVADKMTDEEIAEMNGLIDAWEPVNDEYGQVMESEAENLKSKDQSVKAAAQARVNEAQKKSEDAFAPVGDYVGSMVAKYGEAHAAEETQTAEGAQPYTSFEQFVGDSGVNVTDAEQAGELQKLADRLRRKFGSESKDSKHGFTSETTSVKLDLYPSEKGLLNNWRNGAATWVNEEEQAVYSIAYEPSPYKGQQDRVVVKKEYLTTEQQPESPEASQTVPRVPSEGSNEEQQVEAKETQEQQPETQAETPAVEQNGTKEENNTEGSAENSNESDTFVLTLEALEASNLDDSVKSGARAWLNGDKSPANQIAYLIAEDYVRNNAGNLEQGGSNADAAQLGESGAGTGGVSTGGGSREGGLVDTQDGTGGVPVGTESGESGTGSVASGNGEGGNSGVSGEASGNGMEDASGRSGRSGGNRSNGSNGRRGGRKDSSEVPSGNAGGETRAELEANLDDALAGLEDVLGTSMTAPVKGKMYAVDPVTLYAALGAKKAYDVFKALAKVAHAAVKLGYYDFKRWLDFMASKVGTMLREKAGLTNDQIDAMIEMMWDYDFTVDGVTHKIKEWASILSQEEMRRIMSLSVEEKRKMQQDAEETETIVGDLDNIRESLPFLLPKQQEDVQKAERQFFDESHADAAHGNGKGYLFTNGTGTGKTYTGLGIIKRFVKQGKGRILIVTPNAVKNNDWINDAKNLGIDVKALKDEKDKGSGVVITTYANFRDNLALLEDEFDLIVYDESHYIMSNQHGDNTSALAAHYMMSNRDERMAVRREAFKAFKEREDEIKEELKLLHKIQDTPTTKWTREMLDKFNELGGDLWDVERRVDSLTDILNNSDRKFDEFVTQKLANPEIASEARAAAGRTKVVFLSASPFNTPSNLEYVEGYVFSYSNDEGAVTEERRQTLRNNFLMENFGSSYKLNKKGGAVREEQEHIANPKRASEEEVKFADKLQFELETMSGRDLDSAFDYSREFPQIEFPEAEMFNAAIQSLSGEKFRALKPYFKHLLEDYPTMTAYMEIFKANMIAPRIRQYVDLGKKVVLFHRRKTSSADLFPPFRHAMDLVENDSNASKQVRDAADEFKKQYGDLFAWEGRINYAFPHETIIREFMTDAEKGAYENEKTKWENDNLQKLMELRERLERLQARVQAYGESADLMAQIANTTKAIDKIMSTYPQPKCALVGVFNGDVKASERSRAINDFNNDEGTKKILVVQVAAGREGISLHDTTGVWPRAQVNISLPQSPLEFIQAEGRIFRIGNMSNAIFEYPLLGLDIELAKFVLKISGRSETSENLALGSRGRGLAESISRAALASRPIDPATATGTGGKELDNRKTQHTDDFDAAMRNYDEWRDEPKPSDINEVEIPDPIGYIMATIASPENGEGVLVPNARRGSVARYVTDKARLTTLEARNKDFARLAALVGGGGRKVLDSTFEDHNIVNKYDTVVINTAHGEKETTGELVKTRINLDLADIEKAFAHTNDSGRVVAIVRSDAVQDIRSRIGNSQSKLRDAVFIGEIKLPGFVLNGTPASIIVLDKVENGDMRKGIVGMGVTDLSGAANEQELFAQIRRLVPPKRNINPAGKIVKRLQPMITEFKNTGCLKRGSEPTINEYSMFVEFANKMFASWYRGHQYWRSFDISIRSIAEGDMDQIHDLAVHWAENKRRLELDDEELFGIYRSLIGYKEERIGGVRSCLRAECRTIELALNKTPMQLRNLAEGRVENEVSGEYDLKGFREVFDSLNNENAEQKALADRVFKAIEQIPGIRFTVRENFNGVGGHNVVAHYVPSRNIIELNGERFNSIKMSDEFKAATVVHEMIHALTCWAIDTYKSHPEKLTDEQKKACADIIAVYDAIKDDGNFRNELRKSSEIEDNAEYGLTNEYEMMAELANPIFRAALKVRKLWKSLINGIERLLGIQIPGVDATEENAFDILDRALETLMNGFDEGMYKAYTANPLARTLNKELPEKDAAYMEAVEKGDMETAQKMVDESAKEAGYTIRAYHGTSRKDRVGNVFRPERATSGPMAFFTENREIAESYSKKRDTSIDYDSDYDNYKTQFRSKHKATGKDYAIYDMWGFLPRSVQAEIEEKAKHIRFDWDGDYSIIYDANTTNANGGWDHQLKWHRGNVLKALNEQWLDSGNLFGKENEYFKVLELAGVTEALEKAGFEAPRYMDPNYSEEGVYDVYLKIAHPFDVDTMVNEGFVRGFEKFAAEHEGEYATETADADMWDKNSVTAEMFAKHMREDMESGNSFAWTSIPDVATAYLKSLGYDGIRDTGGKNGGEKHTVWIPFASGQIKSAGAVVRDDAGVVVPLSERFDETKEDIRFQRVSGEVSAPSEEEVALRDALRDVMSDFGNELINAPAEVQAAARAIKSGAKEMRTPGFFSNATRAVEGIKQEKATPEQWLAMIQKAGGIKAGEDKWTGLSDWLKGQTKKTLTKQEVLDYLFYNRVQLEEVHYGERRDVNEDALQMYVEKFRNLKNASERDNELERAEDALAQMIERYGKGFDEAFDIENKGDEWLLVPNTNWDGEYTDEAKMFLGAPEAINSTRLRFTTEGLEEKREVALTVPTVEPYHGNLPEVHFDDPLTEGKTIAWVRFGDTTTSLNGEVGSVRIMDELEKKYGNPDAVDKMTDEDAAKHFFANYLYRIGIGNREDLERAYDEIQKGVGEERSQNVKYLFDVLVRRSKVGRRVLVIDEIQSQRHQDARENGYKDTNGSITLSAFRENGEGEQIADILDKNGKVLGVVRHIDGDGYYAGNATFATTFVFGEGAKWVGPFRFKNEAVLNFFKVYGGVPGAPFEKNWHELAMKRILRLAAEEGYDKLAWTTGKQQAERYDIGSVAKRLVVHEKSDGYRVVAQKEDGTFVGEWDNISKAKLPEFIGKELAQKVESGESRFERNGDVAHIFTGQDLRIGGEGMKGFYDEMLPRFMDKYGKKWGVKTHDIELPNLEEAGRTMHAIDITPEMRRSVMEGQPMFMRTNTGHDVYGFTYKGKIYYDESIATAETLIHEYTHMWAEALRHKNPAAWGRLAEQMLDGDLYDYVKSLYPELKGNDLLEEVFAHFSGRRGEARLRAEQARLEKEARMDKAAIRRMFDKLRKLLTEFWEQARNLFAGKIEGIENISAEDFADMALNDILSGFDPRTEMGGLEEEAQVRAHKIADPYLITKLESEPTVKRYRAMALIDGKLYPPMTIVVDGKMRDAASMNRWEQSDETPFDFSEEQMKEMRALEESGKPGVVNLVPGKLRYIRKTNGGKVVLQFNLKKNKKDDMWVAYNPYFHTSTSPLNDQFASAYNRPELVVAEVEVPESELTAGYKAEGAKDGVGNIPWHSGTVNAKLPKDKQRTVTLSRYSKIIRVVPDSEIAEIVAPDLKASNISVPYNVVTPSLRGELKKQGVTIEGEPNNGPDEPNGGGTRFRNGEGAKGNSPASLRAVRRTVEDMVDKLNLKGRVLILNSAELLGNNDPWSARRAKSKGWYDTKTGKITLVLDNHDSLSDIWATLLHEGVAHFGLRNMVGEDNFNQFLDDIYNNTEDDVHTAIDNKAKELSESENGKHDAEHYRRVATEEYMAELAETMLMDDLDSPSIYFPRLDAWWVNIKQAFLDMMGRLGFGEYFNHDIGDNELRYLLWRSYKNLSAPGQLRNRWLGNAISEARKEKARRTALPTGEARSFDEAAEDEVLFRRAKRVEAQLSPQASAMQRAYNAIMSSPRFRAKEGLVDYLASLEEFQKLYEKHTGKKVRDSQNAYWKFLALSSKIKEENDLLEGVLLHPLSQAVYDLVGKKKLTNADFEKKGTPEWELSRYIKAKHGIERNRDMSVRENLKGKDDGVQLLEQYYDEITALKATDGYKRLSWRKQQEALDAVAAKYGFDFTEDYSGMTEDFADIGGNIRPSIMDWVEQYERDHGLDKTNALWQAIKGVTEFSLNRQAETGLMALDEVKKQQRRYDYFVPLRGFEDMTALDAYDYPLGTDKRGGNPVKKAKGRTSAADNPIASMINVAYRTINSGNKNEAAQALLDLCLGIDDDLVAVDPVWYNVLPDGTKVAAYPTIPDDATPDEINAILDRFEQDMEMKAAIGLAKREKGSTPKFPHRIMGGDELREHQVFVWVGGVRRTITFAGDPRVALAVNGELRAGNNAGMLSAVNSFMAGAFTSYNPSFALANLARDTFHANIRSFITEDPQYWWALTKKQNFGIGVPGALYDTAKMLFRYSDSRKNNSILPSNAMEKRFWEFMENGGATGYTFVRDQDASMEELRKIVMELHKGPAAWTKEVLVKMPMRLFQFCGEAAELTNRFAAYEVSRDMGRSIVRSVHDAKEITLNFNKRGAGVNSVLRKADAKEQKGAGLANAIARSGTYGKACFVFFNARVQGAYQMYDMAKNHPLKFSLAYGAVPLTFAAWALPMLNNALLPALYAACGVGGDDDDDKVDYFDALSDYTRAHNICFRLPGKAGWLKIPVTPEIATFFSWGDRIGQWLSGHKDLSPAEAGTELFKGLVDMSLPITINYNSPIDFALSLVPSALRPGAELTMNKDFMGRKWYKDGNGSEYNPRWMNAVKNESPTLIELSKRINRATQTGEEKTYADKGALDIAPSFFRAFGSGYMGGFFNTALAAADAILSGIRGEEKQWLSSADIPVIGRFWQSGSKEKTSRDRYGQYYRDVVKFVKQMEHTDKVLYKDAEQDASKVDGYLDFAQSERYQKYSYLKPICDAIEEYTEAYGTDDLPPDALKLMQEAREYANGKEKK